MSYLPSEIFFYLKTHSSTSRLFQNKFILWYLYRNTFFEEFFSLIKYPILIKILQCSTTVLFSLVNSVSIFPMKIHFWTTAKWPKMFHACIPLLLRSINFLSWRLNVCIHTRKCDKNEKPNIKILESIEPHKNIYKPWGVCMKILKIFQW